MLVERVLFPHARVSARALRAAVGGRTALVTGASRGIGAETAVLLGAAGARVVLVGRDEERLAAVARRVVGAGGSAHALVADLRVDADVQRILDDQVVRAGISLLVSNAGKSIHRRLRDSLDRFRDVQRTHAVNLLAPTRLVLGLAPALARAGGMVVNVSAVNVLLPPAPGWAAYQSSKAAFDQWLRSAAPELEAGGVAVGTAYLPLVRTDMVAANPTYDASPAMSAAEAARVLCRMAARRDRRWTPWWIPPAELVAPAARPLVEAAFRARSVWT